MKVAIFGTGNYCKLYSKFINPEDILFYIDNKPHGDLLDGKRVYTPCEVNFDHLDYVFILVKEYEPIRLQLLNLGVEEKKIYNYYSMASVVSTNIFINISNGVKIKYDVWYEGIKEKTILLCTHQFTRTGVPIAILNLANLLRDLGYETVVGGLSSEHSLKEELEANNMPYVEDLGFLQWSDEFEDFINCFDLIVLGTIALADFGKNLHFYEKPVVWWINEKYINLYERFILPNHKENMTYFIDGQETVKVFESYYPDRVTNLLYYYLPEDYVPEQKKRDDKFIFTVVGTLSIRKAQDIFIDAANMLSDITGVEFWVVGSGNGLKINWDSVCKDNPRIKLWGEVTQKELINIMKKTDVLVCPSRDDTVPIVVSQAFQNYIPCIVTDVVGQSIYMNDGKAGFVVRPDSAIELSKVMVKCLEMNGDEFEAKGQQAREIFNEHFSKDAMIRELKKHLIPLI